MCRKTICEVWGKINYSLKFMVDSSSQKKNPSKYRKSCEFSQIFLLMSHSTQQQFHSSHKRMLRKINRKFFQRVRKMFVFFPFDEHDLNWIKFTVEWRLKVFEVWRRRYFFSTYILKRLQCRYVDIQLRKEKSNLRNKIWSWNGKKGVKLIICRSFICIN